MRIIPFLLSAAVPFLLLAACVDPGPGDGSDLGSMIVLEPSPEPGLVEATDLSDGTYTWECHAGAEPEPPRFDAVGQGDRIIVTHHGVWSTCDTEWVITGTVFEGEIRMWYEQLGQGSSCTCQNTLTYAIDHMPPGDWTVVAEVDGSSATVTVPGG